MAPMAGRENLREKGHCRSQNGFAINRPLTPQILLELGWIGRLGGKWMLPGHQDRSSGIEPNTDDRARNNNDNNNNNNNNKNDDDDDDDDDDDTQIQSILHSALPVINQELLSTYSNDKALPITSTYT
ncbi:hypothetical protein PoB_001449900 [Plakobranchus ocellatus]|uniref:Uncharacterized protein n=1 Tax=Plakobranchus ocellatus TaxID=259542 RepID=A0AAV3Z0S1_9GAST|nr:hypothetical protein PoB_001449900 [Plakobranchus ocellatus]